MLHNSHVFSGEVTQMKNATDLAQALRSLVQYISLAQKFRSFFFWQLLILNTIDY